MSISNNVWFYYKRKAKKSLPWVALNSKPNHFFAPVFLGSGENLFAGQDSYRVDLPKLGFTETQTTYGKIAIHMILKKSK